jgi:protein-tyrosine phosphatase
VNEAPPRRAERPLSIVFVCTGNRFRSPLAAAYLHRLCPGANLRLSTCGTAAVARESRPPLPEAAEVAASCAIDLSVHRSRSMHDAQLGDADLVIGFERSHVSTAVLEGGAIRERTFTLHELIASLRTVEDEERPSGPDSIRRLVARADAARARRPTSGFEEVPDPMGRSRRFYERTARELWRLSIELSSLLCPETDLAAWALPKPRLRRSFVLVRR